MTSTTFKERYSNHKKSFEDPRYAKSTELSKHIWNLKNMKRSYNIKWTILKRSTSYRSVAKNCNLCLQEKLQILKRDKNKLLNKRCELFSKCRHRKRFVAGKFKSMHARPSRQQSSELAHASNLQGLLTDLSPDERKSVKL